MALRYRIIASLACVIVALDCFIKEGGELGLPYWLWAVVAVGWLLNAAAMFARTA